MLETRSAGELALFLFFQWRRILKTEARSLRSEV